MGLTTEECLERLTKATPSPAVPGHDPDANWDAGRWVVSDLCRGPTVPPLFCLWVNRLASGSVEFCSRRIVVSVEEVAVLHPDSLGATIRTRLDTAIEIIKGRYAQEPVGQASR